MREKQNVRILNLEGVPPAVGPFSHVAIVEPDRRQALISGQVAADSKGNLVGVGDFTVQCRLVFENLRKVVAALGATFDDVAFIRGYLSRAADLPAYREERERFYTRVCKNGFPPTTTLVVASLYHSDCLIEVEAVAVLAN